MLANYFKIAWRNLAKQKGLSFINIFGLSVGIACFSLFTLYAVNELNFDNFHNNAESIYRVYQWDESQNTGDTYHPMPLGSAMKRDLRGVKDYVRIRNAWRESFIKADDKVARGKISFADPHFFSVFSFRFKEGNAASALADLYSVVLTEETAIKIWGKTNVVGKRLQIKVQDVFVPFIVTGVAENIPSNSSITFDMLGNFNFLTTVTPDGRSQANNWRYSSSQTYIQFIKPDQLPSRTVLDAFYKQYNAGQEDKVKKHPDAQTGVKKWYGFQPLKTIHTDTRLTGASVPPVDPKSIWILIGIATGVLLIACINFTTLAIGRSATRSKEVGMRKVMGGTRRSLISQFITEAFMSTILSGLFGALLAQLLLPFFNELSEKKLQFSFIMFPQLSWLLGALIFVVALLAGSYPAFILSRFKPIDVLKTKMRLGGSNIFTRSLVTGQFVLSTGLIIATWTIIQQVSYMQSKSPGFNKENLIVIDADGTWPREIYPLFKQQVAAHPQVIGVTGSDQTLGKTDYSGTDIEVNGSSKKINEIFVTDDFLQIMDMELLAGRNFDPRVASDTINSIIINETMMKEFGFRPENVIGKHITSYRTKLAPVIIGVVKDFNYQPFTTKIESQVFHQFAKNRPYKYFVRVKPDDPAVSLAAIEASWKKIVPDLPFKYSFLNDDLNKGYKAEARWSNIVGWAGGISFFLACLGLLGLASLAVVNRTREIGTRKILGASVAAIIRTISKDFLRLVFLAFIIASPFTWYFMHQWLQDFAYRIHINWWVFVITGTGIVGIALTIVGLQAIKIASANPVKSLRTE